VGGSVYGIKILKANKNVAVVEEKKPETPNGYPVDAQPQAMIKKGMEFGFSFSF